MTGPTDPRGGPSGGSTVATAVVVALLQLAAVFNPLVVEPDPEERFNAGHGLALVSGHLGQLWHLQYREYCGGCTLDAVMGGALFSVLPPSWLVWKLVPIAFSVLLVVVGFRSLHRQVGPAAGWALAALVAFPPRAWLHLSLIAWGNHYEAGVLGACVLLVVAVPGGPRRALAAGALAGVAVWIGFSGSFAVLGGLAWLAWTRPWRELCWFLAGVPLGLLPWLGQWLSAGSHPFVTIYETGETLPDPLRIPHKLATLLGPRQLVALFGLPGSPLGWALGWGWAASFGAAALVAVRRGPVVARAAGAFLTAWLAMYLVVRFQVYDPPAPEIAVPGSARYAAPLYPAAFVLLAATTGTLWRRQRPWAVALLALPLAAGVAARVEVFRPPFPATAVPRLKAVDYDYFRLQGSYVLDRQVHLDCTDADPDARAWHAYALGRDDTDQAITSGRDLAGLHPPSALPEEPWLEGVGEKLADQAQGDGAEGIRIAEVAWSRARLIGGLDPQRLEVIVRSAAWIRPQGGWSEAIASHDATALDRLRLELARQPEVIAHAIWWVAGRRWARDIAGLATPTTLTLPAGATLPEPFVEGFGVGLGEEWGPQARLPRPQGLSESNDATLLRGYLAGERRDWLVDDGEGPPEVVGGSAR